jgi:hypothetical protein
MIANDTTPVRAVKASEKIEARTKRAMNRAGREASAKHGSARAAVTIEPVKQIRQAISQ